ncbi:arylsulfotransferase family protein [Natrinema halophilum]|uniref:arylsulfotransferase family protein n=1 Tax=Natrinema halophilum TaxID=1699371 RepID=UPI001F459922|nr:arylsulfotransferase family protein [Natrinema halophilum]UHQ96198.1 aryl-sulfate sulfotransferase [Natrinema halophilum]
MERRNILRVLILAVLVGTASSLAVTWFNAPTDATDAAANQRNIPLEDRTPVVEKRDGATVITTDPPGGSDGLGAIVAFSADGRPLYHNDTYGNYFDVDPDPPDSKTVRYVAGSRYDPCPHNLKAQADGTVDGGCAEVAIERVNLTTGTTERIHTAVTGWDIWHDVDRIDEHRLLVADIARDRVFTLNTTTDEVTWEWRASADLDPDTGGKSGDWTHVNDVELLADGRVMVSLRNQDRVVFLEPGEGLQRDWTLGAEDAYGILYEQHNPDYIPPARGGPAVIVSDSENNRVLEYQRENATWTRTWEWKDERLRWPRDADRLPGGHTLVTDSQGNRVIELSENNDIVWSVNIATPYEAERLGTGDESTTGRSTAALARGPIEPAADGMDRTSKTGLSWIIAFITGPVVNGILHVAPTWMTIGDLVVAGVFGITAGTATILEVYWSGIGHRLRR